MRDTPQATIIMAASIQMPANANNSAISSGGIGGIDCPVPSTNAPDISPQPTKTTSDLASTGVRSAAR